MEPQRFGKIKQSLEEIPLEELQEMSNDLEKLITVLMTRQVAIQDAILDRLEAAFAR
jgi:nitrate reductase NapAB chaperone NapD